MCTFANLFAVAFVEKPLKFSTQCLEIWNLTHDHHWVEVVMIKFWLLSTKHDSWTLTAIFNLFSSFFLFTKNFKTYTFDPQIAVKLPRVRFAEDTSIDLHLTMRQYTGIIFLLMLEVITDNENRSTLVIQFMTASARVRYDKCRLSWMWLAPDHISSQFNCYRINLGKKPYNFHSSIVTASFSHRKQWAHSMLPPFAKEKDEIHSLPNRSSNLWQLTQEKKRNKKPNSVIALTGLDRIKKFVANLFRVHTEVNKNMCICVGVAGRRRVSLCGLPNEKHKKSTEKKLKGIKVWTLIVLLLSRKAKRKVLIFFFDLKVESFSNECSHWS